MRKNTPPHPVFGHQLVSLLLLGVLVSLAPFAQASPIDPSWLGGLYDGGDADEAVLLAISTPGTVDVAPIVENRGALIVVGYVVSAEPAHPPVAARVPCAGRAPPLR